MKKEEYEELLLLSTYGELNAEEQVKLEKYAKSHPEIKAELERIQEFQKLVKGNISIQVSDSLVEESRKELRQMLRSERNKKTFVTRSAEQFVQFFQGPLKLAFGGTGVLAVGIVVGYFVFHSAQNENGFAFQSIKNSNNSRDQSSQITNIKFIDGDASDGIVEFEFETVTPMHLKGKIDNPEVQKILTYALLNESNDGIRLRTVNAIAQQAEQGHFADSSVKQALIRSLKEDENPGVRGKALRALQQYRFDDELRDALLYVLAKDKNSGMRIAAINALETARIDGNKFDDTVAQKLKQQIENEKNNYIRNRAVNFVKEIYQ